MTDFPCNLEKKRSEMLIFSQEEIKVKLVKRGENVLDVTFFNSIAIKVVNTL